MDKILEEYQIGLSILKKFFDMPRKELFETLKDLCGEEISEDLLEESSTVYKEIVNDEPHHIKVCSWDTLKITSFGISFKREHGTEKNLVKFNKYFKL